jgi:hypothetical protein
MADIGDEAIGFGSGDAADGAQGRAQVPPLLLLQRLVYFDLGDDIGEREHICRSGCAGGRWREVLVIMRLYAR